MISLRTLCLAAVLCARLSPALAASGYATDAAATKTELQAVISKQLDALQHDDAAGAEAFAAPGIQKQFGTPARFLDMVKEHYGALIHPRSTAFGEMASSPDGPLQKVTVVAADGTVWTAIYAFERVDGTWRISGVALEKNDGQQDI